MSTNDRTLTGVALMLGFCLIAPLIDVASKLAGQGVSVGTVTFGRFLVQGTLMVPVVWLMGVPLSFRGRALRLTALRAAVSILSTFCFIAALRTMPIADALAIAFVEPFIILLIGRFVMGEHVGPRRLGAAVVGFAGSLMVIQPAFSHFGLSALFPLGTAVGFALYILVTRALAPLSHPVAMQFETALLAAIFCLPLFLLAPALGEPSFAFQWPTGIFWLWCFCVGLAATISHMSMTYALRYAPSSTLAPLHYLEIVPAAGFSYLVFGDFPNALTWAGIATIVAAGLYIIHRERIAARRIMASAALVEAP